MKAALQLNQSLKQSLSTAVQQAIELLALPAIELKLHIQSILDHNPLLELDEHPAEAPHSLFDYLPRHTASDFSPDIPDTKPHTVKAHLLWQLSLSHWSERDILMATYLIDDMNDEGHLENTLSEIHASIPTSLKITLPEMQTLLLRIQQFERLSIFDMEYRPISDEMHIPDLMVGKQNGSYVVTLNMDFIPELKMVSHYADKKAKTARDKKFMVDAQKEARWFLKALHIRNQHLLETAQAIVCRQHPFLEYGMKAMVPLHYHHIAKDTGLHESTISRLVCNKLILTPQGLFELKSFFGNGVQPLQAMIKQLVAEESRQNPVSDQQLMQLLLNRGFKTTRRTVAKYREAMDIPSSYHRKRGIAYGNSNNRS